MSSLRRFVLQGLGPLASDGISALAPGGIFKPLLETYWKSCVKIGGGGGFAIMLLGHIASRWLDNPYFSQAAKEQLSPLTWNLLVVFGLLCFFVAHLARSLGFHRHADSLLNGARSLLNISASMGALAYGVLVGWFAIYLAPSVWRE